VIKLSGGEYKVKEGEILKVNKLSKIDPKVIMYSDGSKITIGNPYLNDVKVDLKVEGEEKGKKITIRRFKAKSRYHKVRGYRSQLTVLQVASIGKVNEEVKHKPVGVGIKEVKTPKKVSKGKVKGR